MACINDTLAVIAITSVGKAQPLTLLTIAPELRNTIYELVFAADAGPVKLLEASPPEKALLQVCKQTLNEAAGLYVAAFRSYWQGTTFTIHCTTGSVNIALHRVKFNMQDVKQIRTLLSTMDGSNFPVWFYNMRGHFSRLSIPAKVTSIFTFRHFRDTKWLLVMVDGVAVDTSHGGIMRLNDVYGPSYTTFSKAGDAYPVERMLTLQQLQVTSGRKLLLKIKQRWRAADGLV
ncbi:hypothetical protein LTR15_007740 [Elasticomyces elasticus]|nr:hypothetical protein LTR15_007740 [Elasticomyces elasticus]